MNAQVHSIDISLQPADNDRLAELCGEFDTHLRQLEQRLGVEINNRGNRFRIIGNTDSVQSAARVLEQEHQLYPLAIRWFAEHRLTLSENGQALLDGAILTEPRQLSATAENPG